MGGTEKFVKSLKWHLKGFGLETEQQVGFSGHRHSWPRHTTCCSKCGAAAWASPGSLLEKQNLRPHLDLLSQNSHFIALNFDYVKFIWSVTMIMLGLPFLQSLLSFRILESPGNLRWLPRICLHHFPCSSGAILLQVKAKGLTFTCEAERTVPA